MRTHHTHRYSAVRSCQIASLNGILKVENYHMLVICQQISLLQLEFSFKGCNYVMELQKVSIFSLK